MKATAVITVTAAFLFLSSPAVAQTISYDPGLPSSEEGHLESLVVTDLQDKEKALPPLSSYKGTYVGVVVYYDINDGVGDWEVVFEANGTIRLSDKFKAKYPDARVSGTFTADGKFRYTNRQTNGVTFTTTGTVDRVLKRFTARFTSNSAGTGVLICHQL